MRWPLRVVRKGIYHNKHGLIVTGRVSSCQRKVQKTVPIANEIGGGKPSEGERETVLFRGLTTKFICVSKDRDIPTTVLERLSTRSILVIESGQEASSKSIRTSWYGLTLMDA